MTTSGHSLGEATLGLRADATRLESDLDSAEKATNKKAQSIGKALTTALTGPILAVGAAAFASTESVNEAFATIQAGTGASGEALAGLENDFREVFTTVPAESQVVASAIADLNTHLGLSGFALQKTATAALELADATGADTAALVDGLGRSMRIFGESSENVIPIMERFLVISENTGVGVDTLAGQLRNYGPVVANMGLSLTEAAGFFGQLNAAGVDVADVMPAINMHMRSLASEGVEDLRGAMDSTISEIREAETTTQALAIATAAFGAEGAQRMTNAIRTSNLSLRDLTAGMENADGRIAILSSETRTLSERLEILKNRVTDQIASFVNWLGPTKDIVGGLAATIAAVGPMITGISTLVTAVKALSIANIKAAFTTGALGTAMRIALGPVGLAITAITLLVAAGVALWKNWDTVSIWVRRVWSETVGPVIETVINKIIDGFNLLTQAYRKPLEGLLFVAEKIAGVFNNDVAESIRNVRRVINEGIPQIEIASGHFNEFAAQGGKAGESMHDFATEARPAKDSADALSDSVDDLSESADRLNRRARILGAPGGSLVDWAESMDLVREASGFTETAIDRLRARYADTGELVGWLAESHNHYSKEVEDLGVSLDSAKAAQDAMNAAAERATATAEKAAKAAEKAAAAHKRLVSSYDSLLTRQNPLIRQLDELRVGFDDLFVEIARQRGQDLESFRNYLVSAGIAYGDTLGLMKLVGEDFSILVAQQFASIRDAMELPSDRSGGGKAGGGFVGNKPLPPQFYTSNRARELGQGLTREQMQEFLRNRGGGGSISHYELSEYFGTDIGGRGSGTPVIIQGDVYGFDDFADKVGEATNQNRRDGLELSGALS